MCGASGGVCAVEPVVEIGFVVALVGYSWVVGLVVCRGVVIRFAVRLCFLGLARG
jgi:hypothetical protein